MFPDVLFCCSKILSAITQPMFWLALWWGMALLMLNRRRRVSALMLWVGLVTLGLLGFRIFPHALMRPLELRYPVPHIETLPHHVGIIVLGGATGYPGLFKEHRQVPLSRAAERMTAPVGLMRAYPHMELIFSGGEGRLLPTGVRESELAYAFYLEQGLDMKRVHLESTSRNTRENAQHVAMLLGSRCNDRWLLVTSASHMPRAVAEFEAVGCKITPYPVNFETCTSMPWTEYSLVQSLLQWQVALHEWLGLAVYHWSQRSPSRG